jgi:hypothetical protein
MLMLDIGGTHAGVDADTRHDDGKGKRLCGNCDPESM